MRNGREDAQNVDEMSQLSRGRFRIFASGTHVDDGSAINIEACQNAVPRQGKKNIIEISKNDVNKKHTPVHGRRARMWVRKNAHLACRCLDLDFVRRDQLWLELAAPLDGPQDALPRIV